MMSYEKVIKAARRNPVHTDFETTIQVTLGQTEIQRMLPHRAPMLLVDSISAVDLTRESMRAHRRIDENDPVLRGHFPGMPVYPGALLVEAMGQASLCLQHLLTSNSTEVGREEKPRSVRLLKIHHALFMKEVLPGDELTLLSRRIEEDSYNVVCAVQALKGCEICALSVMEVFLVDDDGEV